MHDANIWGLLNYAYNKIIGKDIDGWVKINKLIVVRCMENVTSRASFLIKFSAQNHSHGKDLSICVCVCLWMVLVRYGRTQKVLGFMRF